MKKDETRYTIRFNPSDPRHRKAMETLNIAGRRKATLIADAVCEYLSRYTGTEKASTLSVISSPPAPFYTINNDFVTSDAQLKIIPSNITKYNKRS
jgi:hypothetical protein